MSKDKAVEEVGPWSENYKDPVNEKTDKKEASGPWDPNYTAPTESKGYNIPGVGNVDPSTEALTIAGTTIAGAATGPAIKAEMAAHGNLTPKQYARAKVLSEFKSPSEVAQQAIKNRAPSVTVEGLPAGAVENYGRSQFVNPQGQGVYYGAGQTGDYSGARQAAKEAIAAEQTFPGMKSIQGGGVPFSVPLQEAERLQKEKLAMQAAQAARHQEEVNAVAQLRAERLAQVKQSPAMMRDLLANFREAPVKTAISRTGDFLNKAISPTGLSTAGSRALGALGGLDVGMQGTDAVNRAMNEQYLRMLISGAGAAGGAAALSRHPIAMPVGMAVTAAAPFANQYLDKLEKEHPELFKKLHLAMGGYVK